MEASNSVIMSRERIAINWTILLRLQQHGQRRAAIEGLKTRPALLSLNILSYLINASCTLVTR
jgi:hypothetical protein